MQGHAAREEQQRDPDPDSLARESRLGFPSLSQEFWLSATVLIPPDRRWPDLSLA